MTESDYRMEIFLVETASEHLERLTADKASGERIEAARKRLAKYRQQLADAIHAATSSEPP